jgi:tetratricopeptide (TPR) repeat protein
MRVQGITFGGAACLALALLLAATPAGAADAAAAEREYRVARRLAAEGSPDAAAALQKVVELDPGGRLADDALLEQALLEPLPRWPEGLGRIAGDAAGRALGLIDRLLQQVARGDRAPEARYYRALLLLEPLQTYDPAAARLELITVATNPSRSEWSRAARYAGAWLAEQHGIIERAEAAYQRLLVDAPGARATARAAVGRSRILLRDGQYGPAARLIEEALQSGVGDDTYALPLKELAVRSALGESEGAALAPSEPMPVGPTTGIRQLAGFATTGAGGLLLGDRKQGWVKLLGRQGGEQSRWELPSPLVVAVNPAGRFLAAAADQIYRLDVAGPALSIGAQAEFAPVTSMVADGRGALWLLDRKGERLGVLEPGTGVPRLVAEFKGSKLTALAWDGRRLIAIDFGMKAILTIQTDGTSQPLIAQVLQKPIAVATDPTGRVAVLDSKVAAVLVFSATGSPVDRFDYVAAGIVRPVAISFGLDGALHLFDESTTAWVKLP